MANPIDPSGEIEIQDIKPTNLRKKCSIDSFILRTHDTHY